MSGLLIVGEWTRAEMRPAVESATAHADGLRIERCRHVAEAMRLLTSEAWFPDCVLICQSWPDEFAVTEIQELIARLPLARWICCFGTWCESDGRNRTLWPIGPRVPARSAVARIRIEFAAARGGAAPLPLTAARDECFLFDSGYDRPGARELAGRRVSAVSPDRAYREWLADLVDHAGAVVVPMAAAPDLVLWDIDPWNAESAARLQAASAQSANSRFVAVAGLAHPEDVMAMELSGASAVVAKLSPPAELVHVLQTLLQNHVG